MTKMDSIPLGKLNSPFPKQPVGLPFVHGSLHYNSSNLSSRCLPIGENFFLNWCPKKGGILSIQHRSEPERVLWSTVPARAFATAALGEPSVDESRGSFAIHDKVLLTVQHQTVHSIRLVRSKEEKEDGDSSDWEELSDDEAASECEDQEFSSGQGRGEDSGVQMLGKRSRDHNDEPPQPLVPGRRGDTVVISGFLFSDYASAQQKVRRSFRRVSSDALGRRGLGALRPRVLLSRLRNIGGSNAEVAESAAPGGRCELSVKYLLTFAEKSDHTVGFSVRLEQPVVELDELNDDDDDDDDDEEQGEEGEEEKEGGEVIELVKEVDVRVGVEEEHWTPRKRRSIECETSGGVTVQEGERESGAAGTSLPLVTVSSVGSIAAGSLAGAGYGGDGGVSRRHLANRRPSWNWDEDFLEPNAGLLAELRAAPPGTSSPGSTSPTTGADSPELAGAPATQLSGSYSEIISDEDERPGGKPSSLPLGGRSDCVLTDVEIAQALPPTPGSSAKRVRPRWRWWWQYLPATDADSPHLEYSQLSQPPRRGLLGRLRRWRRLAMEGERRSRRRLLRHWLRLGGPLALNRVQLTYASEAKERFFGFGAQFSQFDVKGLRVPVLVQEQGIGRGDQPITFLANVASHMGGGDWHTTYAPVPQYITSEMRCAYLESHEFSVFDLRQRDCVQIQVHSGQMDGRIVHGRTPGEIIQHYTAATGRMRELPPWITRGAIVGMQGGTDKVRAVMDRIKQDGMPVSAFWLQDWCGQRKTMFGHQLWWNWELDRDHYHAWESLVADLATRGIRVMAYCNPYLAQVHDKPNRRRDMFGEATAKGLTVRNAEGRPYMIENTSFQAAMLDLSNPATRAWFKRVVREMVGVGIRGWMADFGEALPFDATLHSGESPTTAHNKYPEMWAQLNREVVDELEAEARALRLQLRQQRQQQQQEQHRQHQLLRLTHSSSTPAVVTPVAPLLLPALPDSMTAAAAAAVTEPLGAARWQQQQQQQQQIDGADCVMEAPVSAGLTEPLAALPSFETHHHPHHCRHQQHQQHQQQRQQQHQQPQERAHEACEACAAAAAAEAEAEALPHYEQTARERQEVEEELAEQRAEEDSQLVFFARAGFRGSPRDCTLFWEGDQMVSWQRHDGIKSAVTGLLTSGLSGFAFNHSDVGGYTTVAHALINVRRSEELLLRWMEVNAFTTVFRTHEGNMPEYNMQFYSSDKTLQQFGRFARVYASWEFYRRQLVKEAAATGMPVVRHLFLHYPKDRQVLKLVYQQFLVGSELLVAPVLDPGHTRVLVYFPPGEEWEHVWTGAKYGSLAGTRGLRVRVPAPLGQPAVFFRTNSRVGLQFRANLKEHGVV